MTKKKKSEFGDDFSFDDKVEGAFILRYQQGWTLKKIANHFHVTIRTVQRWLALYKDKNSRYWKGTRFTRRRKNIYDEPIRNRVEDLRREVPTRPGTTIHRMLKDEIGDKCPSIQTIRRILRERGLTRERKKRRKNYIKFEREKPNELWQIDFKGWSRIGNLGKLHLLAILDDHSRYIVAARWFKSAEENHVIRMLRDAFKEHGLPIQILSDNGVQFKNMLGENTTRYFRILTLLGVEPIYHAPGHPETKGKLERWFGTVQSNFMPEAKEFIKVHPGATLHQFNERFQDWVRWYNFTHEHASLDGKHPGLVYMEHPDRVQRPLMIKVDWDRWASRMETRKVTKQGIISVDGKKYILPDGHAKQEVQIRRLEGILEVIASGMRVETFQIDSTSIDSSHHVTRKVATAGTFKYKRRAYYIGYKNAHKIVTIQEAANGKDLLIYDGDVLIMRIPISDGVAY